MPLSTLALQKEGTKPSVLRLTGEAIMKLAEELYQAGFISYPRTETDCFDPGMDLMVPAPCQSFLASNLSLPSPRQTSHISLRHCVIHLHEEAPCVIHLHKCAWPGRHAPAQVRANIQRSRTHTRHEAPQHQQTSNAPPS